MSETLEEKTKRLLKEAEEAIEKAKEWRRKVEDIGKEPLSPPKADSPKKEPPADGN